MLIRKLSLDDFEPMGDCRWQLLYPWQGVADDTPFYSGWTHLAPGQKTKKHQHHETETYFVAYGRGTMRVEGRSVEVGPGDVIYMPPFNDHVLENTDASEDLLFLSVFWENLATVPAAKKESEVRERPARALVAAPAGAGLLERLGADVHARYLAMRGVAAEPVPAGDPGAAAELLAALAAAGRAIRAEVDTPYCPSCDSFLSEHEVAGTCPACGAQAQGFACDACARPVSAGTLREPACRRCGTRPEMRPLERLVLPLAEHAEALGRWLVDVRLSPRLRGAAERTLHAGLPAMPLTHRAPSGETPRPELAALDAWLAAPETAERVLFVAPGQARTATLLLPALLLAAGREAALPRVLIDHEPLALVDPVAELAPAADLTDDGLRLHLAAAWPETEPGELTVAGVEQARRTLAGWRRWAGELSDRLQQEYGGQVPATGLWTDEQHQFHRRLLGRIGELGRSYEARGFSLPQVVRELETLAWDTQRFVRREQHWVGVPDRKDERRTSLALELTAARALAMAAAPLVPGFAGWLWRALGEEGEILWEDVPGWVPAGRGINRPGRDVSACEPVE